MKKFWKKLFNSNKGWYIERLICEDVTGDPYFVYLIYREYVLFGIPGLQLTARCISLEQLNKWIKILKISEYTKNY